MAEKESRIIQSLYLYSVSRFCDVISATKVLWPLTDEIGYSIMGDNYVTFTLWHEQSALSVLNGPCRLNIVILILLPAGL